MEPQFLLGFDIGGTKSAAVLATEDGRIVDRTGGPTEIAEGPTATINRLIADARRMTDNHPASSGRILGVGICCGGPLDSKTGVIHSPANLPGWDDVPIVEMVQEQLHLPAFLENDADCCALAELFYGAGTGKNNLVSFTWGTGIGAGIIIGRKLHSGSSGLAGEMGHITYVRGGRPCQCGKRGCIEAYASGSSIGRIAGEMVIGGRRSSLSDTPSIDARAVCDAARSGDQMANEILTDAARAMGHAVSIAAHTLNPEVITLGTMSVKAGDILMPELMRTVDDQVWERTRLALTITPSPLGDRVQDLAAISAMLQALDRR
jgi:glucokinase